MVFLHVRNGISILRHSSPVSNLFTACHHRGTLDAVRILTTKRFLGTCRRLLADKTDAQRSVMVYSFEDVKKKEKESFLDVLRTYESYGALRSGHTEFITAAMEYMDEFGVNEDLEVYKKLIDVLPKGKYIATSPMLADFGYYAKQQQCIVDLLEKMEGNGVIPDYETQEMLLNIFGQFGVPLRKFWRMMYWMPKFRNLNPWPTPRPVPNDATVLARIAIDKISSVDIQTRITIFRTDDVADSIDKTWIVSAISPEQQDLLKRHPKNEACYVEGPYKVWVAHVPIDYFVLRAEPRPSVEEDYIDEDDVSKINAFFWDAPASALGSVRSVHEQEDATIFSVCATGTSSKDSLLSWIRCLQRTNPVLESIPILFTFTGPVQDTKVIPDGNIPEENSPSRETHKIEDN